MTRLIHYLILVLGLLSTVAPAQRAVDFHFQKGNEFYLNEQYSEAIQEYEAVLHNGLESAELYYNLGNSYYKAGRLGKAILNYERALQLRPKDANTRFNLQLSNLRVKDRIDVPPEFWLLRWHRELVQALTVAGWARLFTLFWLLASGVYAARQVLNLDRFRRLSRRAMLLFFLAALLSLGLLLQRHGMEYGRAYGIILADSSKSLAAPQEGSTELFIVHEGTRVQVLDSDGDWSKIQLIDGKQAWVRRSDLEII